MFNLGDDQKRLTRVFENDYKQQIWNLEKQVMAKQNVKTNQINLEFREK